MEGLKVKQIIWPRVAYFWIIWALIVFNLTCFLVGCDVAEAAEWADLGVVHKTLIAEAGGEGMEGMIAVGNVIRNRAIKRGLTVEEVCLQRLQFSAWNEGAEPVDRMVMREKAVWDDALTAWQVSGTEDITMGADLYHADYVRPDWNWSKTVRTVKVGKHIFYRELK